MRTADPVPIGIARHRLDARHALAVVRRNWLRVLLAVLGCSQILMAASAPPGLMALGVASGAALIGGALLARRSRLVAGALITLGTVPFAVAAWTALVPVLVLLAVAALAGPVLRCHGAGDVGPPRHGRGRDATGRRPAPLLAGKTQ